MKRGYMVLASIVLLLSINLVIALDTQVDIKTSSNAPLTIRFQNDQGTLENGAFIDQIKNSEGIISVTFSSDIDNYVKISVGGNSIPYKFFRDVKTGWIYSIDLSQSPPMIIQGESTSAPVIEETPTETPEETPTETPAEESETQLTGAVISEKVVPMLKKVGYFAAIIFGGLILIASFLFVKKKKSKKAISAIKFRDNKNPLDDAREDSELEDAERKIKEAEAEIKHIKNRKSELNEAKRKFEEDKKRLKELRERENQGYN